MQALLESLGGRKAVALWIAVLVALVLIVAGRWIAPPDQLPIVDRVLTFLQWAIASFMGSNAVTTAAYALSSGKKEPEPPVVPLP